MIAAFALGLALTFPANQLMDTTIAVRRGIRLDVQTREGAIQVTTWNRDEVRISVAANGGSFSVESSRSVVRVRPQRGSWRRSSAGRGRDRYEWDDDDDEEVGFDIRVPVYMAVTLHTIDAAISVRGTQADVVAETTEGDVRVTGGAGRISIATVEGLVDVVGARGRVEVAAGDGDIRIRDVVGEIDVETIDGDITITEADSRGVEANTVDGDIIYRGSILNGGRYNLSTHDGDITLSVQSNVSADVTVANFNGGFETNFPVVLRESQRKRLRFTLGSGGAQVRLEAFDGDVFLRRSPN